MSSSAHASGAERAGSQRGSASVELIGLLPILVLAALGAWQLLLWTYTATAAENAARSASRAESLGRDGPAAAQDSMSSWLRRGASTDMDGTRATVTIKVPILFPPLRRDDLEVSETAVMPSTQ